MVLPDSVTYISCSTFTRSSGKDNPEMATPCGVGTDLETRLGRELSQLSSQTSGVTDPRRTMIKQKEMPTAGFVFAKVR